MKSFKPFLILLLALAVVFVSSTAVWAKNIKGKANGTLLRVDAAGNLTLAGPAITVTLRAIKFPKSGVIINRLDGKTTNESGARQRFKNTGFFNIFDPELGFFPTRVTRDVVIVGKPNKRNFAQTRHTRVFNPKKAP